MRSLPEVTRLGVATGGRLRLIMVRDMADLRYVVSFKGAASPTLRSAFANCNVDTTDGLTFIRCAHADLNRVMAQIQDFGLELVDLRLVADREPSP